MTVPSIAGTTGPIPGDGSNAIWSFSFSVASDDEIDVILTNSSGGFETLDSSLYSVALSGGGQFGGLVTYPLGTGRVPEGSSITIQIAPDFDQPTRLTDQGPYDASTVERGLDHIVRQTQALREQQRRALLAPPGIPVEIGTPVDGQPLRWLLLSSGTYQIASGEPTSDNSSALRVLYADDLGLAGDGTDETAALNAKILEISDSGKPAIIYLRAPAGNWPLTAQLKIRSGVSLSMGSPFKATKDGRVGFVGNYARFAAGGTVTTATSAGATTIPVTPTTGSVSDNFVTNDQVELGGGERVRITGVDDGAGTITVATATTADLAAGAGIRKLILSYCSSDWTRHDTPNELAVADNGLFSVGDVVLITDDETTTAGDGSGTALVNSEIKRVIGFGSGTLKFDGSVKHWMTTANRARVIKLNPCQYASLANATVEFTEAPDSDRVDTFESSIAWKCEFLKCGVPNDDSFGTRGRAFNLSLCYQCEVLDCYAGPAKYTDAGEGYGIAFDRCTDCHATRFLGVGCRHVLSFIASTDCAGRDIRGFDWTNNLIDFHGQREIGCWVYVAEGTGSGRTSQTGIALGNPTWRGGTYECGVEGGEITDLQGTGAAGLMAWGPMDDCDVRGVVFRRVARGFYLRDQDGAGSTEIGTLRIACDFHRADVAGEADLDFYGSSSKPLNRLDLTGSRFFDWVDGLKINDVDDVAVDVEMRTTRAASGSYAVDLDNCTSARISGTYVGCDKHFKLVDTPARIEHYRIVSPGTTTLLDELSASAVSGGVRDAYGVMPAGYVPVRTSAETTVTVYSLPGMT